MSTDSIFSEFQPAVEKVTRFFDVAQSANFMEVVRDELSEVNPSPQTANPDEEHLRELYELRSQYLDWELGTGYLGFFSKYAGTRYTFTRRIEIISQLFPPLTPESRVLEIGCGAGLLCFKLAQRTKAVVGIDISQFALNFANSVKEYVPCDNVSFQIADAENLIFRDQVFDLVICSEVLEHLLSPEKALYEIRRVIKDTGTIILTTPSAISLSNMSMSIVRLFNKHIETEKNIHFDKKTYFAIKRKATKEHSKFGKKSAVLHDKIFMRVHERFRYNDLLIMFHNAGFELEEAIGAVFAFPPHYQVFYRYCPVVGLPIIRGLEHLLNKLHLFRRFGAVTTCFRLKPIRDM